MLEVRHGHSAGVAQEVGDDENPVLVECLVRIGGGGAVSQLRQNPGFDVACIPRANLILQRSGDEQCHVQFQQLRVGDVLRAGKILDRACLLLVSGHRLEVQTLGIVDTTFGVGHGDYFAAEHLGDEFVRELARITVALHSHRRLGQVNVQHPGCLADTVHAAFGRRVTPARGATQRDGLAGDHTRHVVASDDAVLVHHPGHDLRISVHIRGRDISFRANVMSQCADVATAHTFELSLRHLFGVADHAAFSSAEGNVHHGRFPGHPGSQGTHGVNGLVGMEANATLRRSPGVVILYAEAFEDLDYAVVHPHREADVELAHWFAEQSMEGGI